MVSFCLAPTVMPPRMKLHWAVTSLFLLNFSLFLTTESFVVRPIQKISLRLQSGLSSRSRSSPTTMVKLFRSLGRIHGSSTSMEFRSNLNIYNGQKYNVSLLIIDHYDSFTYNLYDMLAQMMIVPPVVVAKDAIEVTAETAAAFFNKFDGIILSPGPGTPEEQPPLSHLAITKNPNLPILGVCLGHQLMALAYGATVDRAPVPIHGQDHEIFQNQETEKESESQSSPHSRYPSLFQSLPTSFRVVRYHSLCAYDLPNSVAVKARSSDNVVQAIQHRHNPHYGVQFHPESIGTQNGMELLGNFLRVVKQRKESKMERRRDSHLVSESTLESDDSLLKVPLSATRSSDADCISRFRVMVHRISTPSSCLSSMQIFEKYYARLSHSIWLDSSSSHTGRGDLDILAAPSRSNDIIEYHIDENKSDKDILSQLEKELFGGGQYRHPSSANIGWVTFKDGGSSLEWVKENDEGYSQRAPAESLPFNYRGGLLGFLGYEVRRDTQRYLEQLEGGPSENGILGNDKRIQKVDIYEDSEDNAHVPTAAFFLARQSMVYHHPTSKWYLIGLVEEEADIKENIEWMEAVGEDLRRLSCDDLSSASKFSHSYQHQSSNRPSIEFAPNRSKETYENDIAECHEYIKSGDSYELCLTNQLEARITSSNVCTFDLYKIIREVNPAPYSSYFRWNISSRVTDKRQKFADVPSSTSLVICSSSPERFMSISKKQSRPEMPSFLQAEAKPIKGTCARVMPKNGLRLSDDEIVEDNRRARSLELSSKNRAENLMIVDLLRNDMSRVCKPGSVHVSKLMDIESFATVHQMVSTIQGTLSDSCSAIDLLRASFPGGSMTGAPKRRSMEILQELEQFIDRGPYSGSLGYVSVNGCMDMNILIRSAVIIPSKKNDGWKISIGAGGAITALSDAEDEYEEMLLKARAVKEAVEQWVSKTENSMITPGMGDAASNSTDALVESQ